MRRYALLAGVALQFATWSFAQKYGGMWLPTELNEKEMKSLGMKISGKDIFNTQRPSIKDAVVHFNRGCTGEIISNQSLLLTNHHCGYGAIQKHSTVQNDLLTDGFWAKELRDELPNPGMVVDFIIDIKDITAEMLRATEGLSGEALAAQIKANEEAVRKNFSLKNFQSVVIKPMYYGNKYYAFVTETFKDVRLVGAPPQSIGKFGSDTDNWVWPRHTGDFSLFRVYANKNNEPAEYSPENVPYKPKYSLPVSVKGIKENDFTFVFGFPGRTTEYLTSAAIRQVMEVKDPAMIEMREASLKILDEKMRQDAATRIKYAAKYASVANYWKKWKGEVEGLQKSDAVEKREAYEQQLKAKDMGIAKTISSLNTLTKENSDVVRYDAYYGELIRNAETLNLGMLYSNFVREVQDGKMNAEKFASFKNRIASFLQEYDAALDAKVTAKLLNIYTSRLPVNELPSGYYRFKDMNFAEQEIQKLAQLSKIGAISPKENPDAFADAVSLAKMIGNDPFVLMYQDISNAYKTYALPKLRKFEEEGGRLQKTYMAELMKTDTSRAFYPDANSTMRVTYGKVKGSNPRDAVFYGYQTHLTGVMEKYIPGDYEFDVPKKLVELYKAKDFGSYKDQTGDVPLAFTATNHTTGGNSGSPALDANGNLIGLNFDRQWEGTMSDINYDPKFSRNIMVDTRYILFIMDKFADAQRLLKEIKIVK